MSSNPNSTSFRDDATPAGGRHAARPAVPARKSVKASAKVSRTPVEAVVPEEAFAPDAAATVDAEPQKAGEGTWTLVPGTGTPSSYSAAATMAKAAEARAHRLKVLKRVVLTVLILVVIAALVVVALLSVERWWTHDDAADIQGTWLIQGDAALGHEAATITITAGTIVLDKDTTYRYTLDTAKKTITFTFQDLEGQGHYRFSADRRHLIIVDGEYSWLGTCVSDFWWQLRSWVATALDAPQPALGSSSGTTLLARTVPAAEPAAEPAPAPAAE